MKKQLATFLLAILLLPAAGLCIANYSLGDQLYVLASSGLVLRETPNPQGKKITSIPLGEPVTVLKENFKKVPHSVVEFTGYSIKGYWVQVRSKSGKMGYVFDGYLSRYRAPGSINSNGDFLTPEQYLLAHTKAKGAQIPLSKGENRYDHYKQLFENGAEVESDSGEGGASLILTFNKGTTLEEGYLIGQQLWLSGKINRKIERGVLTLENEEQTQQVVVENKAGKIVVTMNIAD